jgi:hypothetical protein
LSPKSAEFWLQEMRAALASGIETRQGGNEVPSRSDESPIGAAGDAQQEQPQ